MSRVPGAVWGSCHSRIIHTADEESVMASDDERPKDTVKPSEQHGGTTPGEREAGAKGPWAARAADGLVPAELGGSDAPREMLDEDPQLKSSVLGATTGSAQPATEDGVNPDGGAAADAASDGAAPGAVLAGDDPEPARAHEPDLRDAAVGPRQSDLKSAK
jgi:hypothetical protein